MEIQPEAARNAQVEGVSPNSDLCGVNTPMFAGMPALVPRRLFRYLDDDWDVIRLIVLFPAKLTGMGGMLFPGTCF